MNFTHGLTFMSLALASLLATGCGSRDPDRLLEEGVRAYAGGHYRSAARSLEKAVKLEPNHAMAQLWCGAAWLKADRPDEALPHFLTAARLDPANPLPLEYAAVVEVRNGNWAEAGKRINEAFRRMPDSPRILNAMGVASAMRGSPGPARAQLNQALRLSNQYAPAFFNEAILSRDAMGQPEEARRFFRRYLELAPDGEKADAARAAMEALGAPPAAPASPAPRADSRTEGRMSLAKAAIQRRDYAEAVSRLQEAVEAAPGWPDPLWELARVQDVLAGRPEQALDAYRTFIRDFPEDARSMQARLRINALAGRRLEPASPSAPPPDLAADRELVFHKPEIRNSREALLSLQRGSRYYQAQDWTRALFDFKRAIEMDDTLPEAYYNLGLVYWRLGDYEHARQLFQNALARRSNWPDARCMLARVYVQQRLGLKAVEHLNEILKVNPTYAAAYYELGNCYRATPARRSQVRTWYGRYLELAPKGAYAPQASAWLAANP
jgi:tetratricopeptide (TPR) repeat protein